MVIAAIVDSIRAQIQRIVLDSLMRTQARIAAMPAPAFVSSGPIGPSGAPRGPRRVVIALPRSNRARADLDAAAIVIADTLRRAFDAHPRYVVVPADSVAAALADSRTVNTVQERLNADIIVSISLIPTRDSLIRLIQVRDLHAPGGQAVRVISTSTVPNNPTASVENVVRETFRTLQEIDRTGRETMRARASVHGTTPPVPPVPPSVVQRP